MTTSTSASAAAKEVFDLLRDDLLAIEQEFQRDAISGVEVITEIGEYLREGGGKRIRPALLLLSAKLCGYEGRGAVRLGSVVEIVHTATLVHDDIIDEALTRRGRPSANTKWGNSKCVLAGDWLYMQAFKIALEEQNFRVLDLLIGLTQQMVEGELMQMERLGHIISQAEHLDHLEAEAAVVRHVLGLGRLEIGGETAAVGVFDQARQQRPARASTLLQWVGREDLEIEVRRLEMPVLHQLGHRQPARHRSRSRQHEPQLVQERSLGRRPPSLVEHHARRQQAAVLHGGMDRAAPAPSHLQRR